MRQRVAATGMSVALAAGTLAAVGGLTGPAHAAQYSTNYENRNTSARCVSDKRITGVIKGYDGRAVNATISMDLNKTVNGRLYRIDGGGCDGAGAGYAVNVRVNYQVPPSGADPASTPDAVTTWYADVPSNASVIFFEVYPRDQASRPELQTTDLSYYSYSMQPNISVGSGGRVPDIYMPLVKCGTLSTGAATGYFYNKNSRGQYVKVVGATVSAFSEGPRSAGTPAGKGPFGFGSWSQSGNYTSYTIGKLASGGGKGQAYTLIARLKDGTQKQFYMYDGVSHVQSAGVFACKSTRYDLTF